MKKIPNIYFLASLEFIESFASLCSFKRAGIGSVVVRSLKSVILPMYNRSLPYVGLRYTQKEMIYIFDVLLCEHISKSFQIFLGGAGDEFILWLCFTQRVLEPL
jgi:hypothetical protein